MFSRPTTPATASIPQLTVAMPAPATLSSVGVALAPAPSVPEGAEVAVPEGAAELVGEPLSSAASYLSTTKLTASS